MNNKTCKDCKYFMGMGDWDLCCSKPPARAKDSWCGFLCYEDTEACENFKPKLCIKLKPDTTESWKVPADWIPCTKCCFFEECETKESRDGCHFGEPEEK